jgi:hypothetical protein
MSDLLKAITTNDTLTTNGMLTNTTSSNHCLDLFYVIGGLRGSDKKDALLNAFIKAYNHNKLLALKILFWSRDVREGAGERQIFRDVMLYLAKNDLSVVLKNIHLISEYGRWDDILPLLDTPAKDKVLLVIKEGLKNNDGLCAKWLPRPNVANKSKKRWANEIRKSLNISPKQYRTLLVNLSNTVEQLMASKQWGSIEYDKIPSKAMSDYMKAFFRNDELRFNSYLLSVKKGERKINASAIYPYDVVKNMRYGNTDGADIQWSSLPNYMEGNTNRILPVVDVSGSMECSAGGSRSITCLDVAISLGLYISERNEGIFKDSFMTFSSTPKLETLKGKLSERYNQLSKANWSVSTNIELMFNELLTSAVEHNVSQDEMPTLLIILSDMEFDMGIKSNVSGQELIEKMYDEAGYKLPNIVYWNLHTSNTNIPVKYDKRGVSLVSGFSPSLLKTILGGFDYAPEKLMLDVIGGERYEKVEI